jgi:type II secretory pathway pseudopilin PulG
MKKIFALVMTVAILMVAAAPSFAQGRNRRSNNDTRSRAAQTYRSRNSQTSYDNSYYDNSTSSYYDYQQYDNRSFWEKHRDKLTVAAGTAGGAAIGGLIGGQKGAVIGALAGLGGSALYTYKIRR